MKKYTNYLLYIIGIGLQFPVFSQSTGTLSLPDDKNYIHIRTMLSADGNQYSDVISYFDAFGRECQRVERGITPAGADLVSLFEYQVSGNTDASWLPVPRGGNNGNYTDPSLLQTAAKSFYWDEYPYTLTEYEQYCFGLPIRETGPGQNWHVNNKSVVTHYNQLTNGPQEVILFKVQGEGMNARLVNNGIYPYGKLFVSQFIDEDRAIYSETAELSGRIIRTTVNTRTYGSLDTYYIYDAFGNLSYVLPHLACKSMRSNPDNPDDDSELLKNYAWLYKYDHRNRCIAKRIPGCDWIYYVYDRAGRIRLVQDGNMRENGYWSFIKYDEAGREIMTGLLKNSATFEQMRTTIQNESIGYETFNTMYNELYTWQTYPASAQLGQATVTTVNYYDNYNFLQTDASLKLKLQFVSWSGSDSHYTQGASPYKGLLTGMKEKVAEAGKYEKEIFSAFYYNNRQEIIQKRSVYPDNITHYEYIVYNFAGQPVFVQSQYDEKGNYFLEKYELTYDHAARLKKKEHRLGSNDPYTLAENTYDELGRLSKEQAGNDRNLEIAYQYNIRSRLTKIDSPLFKQTLFSEEENMGNTPYYNGNIASMQVEHTDNKKEYRYVYDELNQLSSAAYRDYFSKYDNYSVSYSYDSHGNVKTINRQAERHGEVDVLTFTYNGNQLIKVKDEGVETYDSKVLDFKDYADKNIEYEYNRNGSMIRDDNKGVYMDYDLFSGMLSQVSVNNPVSKGVTQYGYTSTGKKISAKYFTDATLITNPVTGTKLSPSDFKETPVKKVLYVENKVNEGKGARIFFENGYNEDEAYYMYIKDYQGNIRMVINQNRNSPQTTIQITDYYPFGLPFASSTNPDKQPYKYNGNELDLMHGLNHYDFNARQLDPALIRYGQIDPLSEKYYAWSPYAYCGNNPVRRTDPSGMDWYEDVDGHVMLDPEVMSQKDLKRGQRYIGPEFSLGDDEILFNGDGSVFFKKEDQAYRRIWKTTKKTGKEELGVILNDGVLVLPSWDNLQNEAKVAEYGYSWINGNISHDKSGTIYSTLGTIHTHPTLLKDHTGTVNPSWMGPSFEDHCYFGIHTPNKPFFVLTPDERIHSKLAIERKS